MSVNNSALELETMSVGQLLRKYSLPAIIAMTASSLYNIVDSIFIGRGCGPMAFAGLSVTFPLMNILAAFGSLVGVGASALIAIKLGEKDYKYAKLILGNVVLLNIILSGIVAVIGLIWLNPILTFFGATEQTIGYAHGYMVIILYANFFTHIYFGLNGVLRSSGHPKLAMIATIVAVLTNVVLDPIFIFWFDMGVQGAALATVISQSIAIIWQAIILCRPTELLHFGKDCFHLSINIATDTLSIGLSPFLMNLAACFVVVIINRQLLQYGGDLAIAAHGVIHRVTFVFCMIVMGLNQGMQPIAGYNYGAKLYPRMFRAYKLCAITACCITSSISLVSEIAPELAIRIFSTDPDLIDIASTGLRIGNCAFFLAGLSMVTGNFFTSIGKAKRAIFLSLTRQVIFLIPFTLILPKYLGINGIWWSLAISDALAVLTAAIMFWQFTSRFQRTAQHSADHQPQQD